MFGSNIRQHTLASDSSQLRARLLRTEPTRRNRPSRGAGLLLTLTASLAVFGCGGEAAGNEVAVSGSSSAVSVIAPGSERRLVRLRWFPADSDRRYQVKMRRNGNSGAGSWSEDSFEIEPTGCTSAARSGVTSGICVYDL